MPGLCFRRYEVSFRYCLSFIPQDNPTAYNVEVAFIAIDAEQLGDVVDDGEVLDLGDNKYPYFKGNGNSVMVNYDDETLLLEKDDEEIQLEARD